MPSTDVLTQFQIGAPNDIASIANVGGQFIRRSINSDITLTVADMGKTHQIYSDPNFTQISMNQPEPYSVYMPDATTLTVGPNIVGIENVGKQQLLLRDSDGNLLAILKPETNREPLSPSTTLFIDMRPEPGRIRLHLADNSTTKGTWLCDAEGLIKAPRPATPFQPTTILATGSGGSANFLPRASHTVYGSLRYWGDTGTEQRWLMAYYNVNNSSYVEVCFVKLNKETNRISYGPRSVVYASSSWHFFRAEVMSPTSGLVVIYTSGTAHRAFPLTFLNDASGSIAVGNEVDYTGTLYATTTTHLHRIKDNLAIYIYNDQSTSPVSNRFLNYILIEITDGVPQWLTGTAGIFNPVLPNGDNLACAGTQPSNINVSFRDNETTVADVYMVFPHTGTKTATDDWVGFGWLRVDTATNTITNSWGSRFFGQAPLYVYFLSGDDTTTKPEFWYYNSFTPYTRVAKIDCTTPGEGSVISYALRWNHPLHGSYYTPSYIWPTDDGTYKFCSFLNNEHVMGYEMNNHPTPPGRYQHRTTCNTIYHIALIPGTNKAIINYNEIGSGYFYNEGGNASNYPGIGIWEMPTL